MFLKFSKVISNSTVLNLGKVWGWVILLAAVMAFPGNSYPVQSSSGSAAKPNIVVIISDDQNVDSLPVMRKLLSYPEGSWVKFNNGIISNSICCPSRATILTGQYSFRTGVISNSSGEKLDDSNTLAVWLDQAGYSTGLFGKYLNGFPWDRGASYIPPGWDHFQTRGFGATPDGMTSAAIEFINNSTGPFFVHVGYWDPHEPAKVLDRYANANVYIPPVTPNFNESNVSDKPLWLRETSPLSQSKIAALHKQRLASQQALLGVDDGIQNIVDALKAKGVLENTMIIYLSDNGVSWGSHRLKRKACVYEECIRAPLFIRYPGLGTNREENRLVSNVDLAATILEYIGMAPRLPPVSPPGFSLNWRLFLPIFRSESINFNRAAPIQENADLSPGLPQDGRSLIPLITNTTTNWQEEVFLEVHAWTPKMTFEGIRVPGWTYAEYANGDKELYDLIADPYQLENKADNPNYQEVQSKLAQRMRELKGK